ncbi:MAG: ThiF family adenylyltransferase [Deltaproteobacteria bacterium]
MISEWATQRSRGISLRATFGATAGAVQRLVLRQALRLIAYGLALALPASFAISRLLQALLFRVSPFDLQACSRQRGGVGAGAYLPARLSSGNELLHFADGSLVFNGLSGRHVQLGAPPPGLVQLLEELDAGAPWSVAFERSQASQSQASPELLRAVSLRLQEAGVLEPYRPAVPGAGWSVALQQRFSTFVDYLEQDATPAGNEYELFERLRGAHVTILGVGGAGSLCAMLLCGSGVGALRLVDGDRVDESNLVRQFFYDTAGVGKPKVTELAKRIEAFTPFTRVETIDRYVRHADDVGEILRGTDFLLLCADAPRFLINRWVNRACVEAKLPYVNAFNGMVGPIYVPDAGPCFECFEAGVRQRVGGLYDQMIDALQTRRPRPYPSSADGCVLIATLQTRECLAHLTGAWQPKTLGHFQRVGANGFAETEPVPRQPDCPVCGPAVATARALSVAEVSGVAS